MILYAPEVAAVVAAGPIPAYNVFPFSGVNRDLLNLLANPNSNFANNVQNAACGIMPGLVHSGNTQALIADTLFAGRQLEAVRQSEQQHENNRKTEALKHEEKPEQHSPPSAFETHAAETASAEEAAQFVPKLGISSKTADTVTAIGKVFCHLVDSELMVSLPTVSLSTFGPAPTPVSLGAAHQTVLAA